jgi:ComEC/Rec2-related protein
MHCSIWDTSITRKASATPRKWREEPSSGSRSRSRPDISVLLAGLGAFLCALVPFVGVLPAFGGALLLAAAGIVSPRSGLLAAALLLSSVSVGISLRAGYQESWRGLAAPPVRIIARCRGDSRPSAGGAVHFLSLRGVEDLRGSRSSAGGKLTAWSKEPIFYAWGSEVVFELLPGSSWPEDPQGIARVVPAQIKPRLPGIFTLRRLGRDLFSQHLSLLPPQAGMLLEALLLGTRRALLAPLAGAFRTAGCAHLLALSGMHLAVIMTLGSFVIGLLLPRYLARPAVALVLPFYLFLVGPGPSLLRAGLMFLLPFFCSRGTRRCGGLRLLFVCFVLMLLIDPGFSEDRGFQYSFAALFGIMSLSPPLLRVLAKRVPYHLAALISAGMAAYGAALPVSLIAGYASNPAGVLATIILTPCIWLYLAGGLIFLALPASSFLTPLFRVFFWVLYRTMEEILACFGRIPSFILSETAAARLAALIALAFLFRLIYASTRTVPGVPAERSGAAITVEFETKNSRAVRRERPDSQKTLRPELSDRPGAS